MASPWKKATAAISPRALDTDPPNVATDKIHAHAVLMTIAFLVLFPLGAIVHHLPLRTHIRHVVIRLHAPIQLLALAMMIAATGLGIDIAAVDDGYFPTPATARAHIILGLIVTCSLILFQPLLGLLQHLYFRKHESRSWLGFTHRWLGRGLIVAGWVNSWLGFRLSGWDEGNQSAIVRNAILMGVFGALWLGLVLYEGWRVYVKKVEKLGCFGLEWERGFVLRKGDGKSESQEALEKP